VRPSPIAASRSCSRVEFASGLGALANYVGERTVLGPSYCLEPEVEPDGELAPGLNVLNVDVLAGPPPRLLDKLFDLVISIEVAEHLTRDRHESLLPCLRSCLYP